MKLGSIEKDKQPSLEILRLFEKTRVAFLSARTDPDEYSGRWRKTVEMIKESYHELDAAGKELKNYIDEEDLEEKEVRNPSSRQALELFEKIKLLRYSSPIVADPFADMFKGNVLEELLSNPESMLKFVHYALRNDNKALSKEVLAIKDMEADSITEGLMGLDIESEDIALYIIEHYGDGKDSKKVESKVKAAMDMLELMFFSQHEEKELEDLKDIEGVAKAKGGIKEKSVSHFIVPNKPMYRIFDIDDINELKGFSGNWYVQEKFDGMRVQLHKLDGKVNIYSYNEKDITDKCEAQVEELKKKEYGDCIFDAELVLFDEDEPLHRADTIAHVFKGKYKDAKLRCHVFDIIRHEAQTLTDEELEDRMTTLFNNYSAKTGEAIAFPSKKDTRQADNLKDIEKYAKEMMDNPASEGVVIKDATSTYYIGTKKNPKWIKWKKFVDLDVIVLAKKKTKSSLYSYTVGVGPITEEMNGLTEINKIKYLGVGKALNTKISVDVGDIIRVKVDEVKKKGEGYSLFSAKVIEIPEVEHPDKLVTLELLSKDTKKSLNYSVESALTKGIKLTDHIHGETNIIVKSDLDGFTIYGFEENNLMSKNAIMDIDMWKAQVEEIMKSKQSDLTVAVFQYLKMNGDKTPKQIHNFLVEKQPSLYEDVLESKEKDIKEWFSLRDGISLKENKLSADDDKIMQEDDIKKSKYDEAINRIIDILQAGKDNKPDNAVDLNEIATVEMDEDDTCCNQLKEDFKKLLLEDAKGAGMGKKYIDFIHEYMAETNCEEILDLLSNPEVFAYGQEEAKNMLDKYKKCSEGFNADFTSKWAMLKSKSAMMAQGLKFKERMKNPTMRVEEKPSVNQNVAQVEIDADVSGDCCEQLKQDLIELEKLSMEDLERVFGSWESFVSEFNAKYRDQDLTYGDSMEEELQGYIERLNTMDCEEVYNSALYVADLFKGVDELSDFAEKMVNRYESCNSFGSDFSDKYAMLKAYKTPENYRKGQFKLYSREDDNITFAIKVDDESMFWTIDLENDEEMFDLFGAAGKYPAEVSKNIERGKIIDAGDIELGVQKDGYHEYFLKGNKFETKLHIRVIKVEGKEMWLAWTGYKQTPADKDGDEGKWNIYQDRYNKLPIPTSK